MSAFVVDDKTTNKLANSITFYAEYGRENAWQTKAECQNVLLAMEKPFSKDHGFQDTKTANGCTFKLAKLMHHLNVSAVNIRYNENEDTNFDACKTTTPLPLMQFLKSLHCWEYQCSEGNIDENEIFQLIVKISSALEHDIVTNSKEYDTAQWN